MSGLRMLFLLLSALSIFYCGAASLDSNRTVLEEIMNSRVAIKEDVPGDPVIKEGFGWKNKTFDNTRNTMGGTTLGTYAADNSRTSLQSKVSGTKQSQEALESEQRITKLPVNSSSTSSLSTSFQDVSLPAGPPFLIRTLDHDAREPNKTEATLRTSVAGNQEPNPTEPQMPTVQFKTRDPKTSQKGRSRLPFRSTSPSPMSINHLKSNKSNPAAKGPFINTYRTRMKGLREQQQTTEIQEPSQEHVHTTLTTEEPDEFDEAANLPLIISLSVFGFILAYACVMGGFFGIVMHKKKLARIRPAPSSADNYRTADDQSGQFANPAYSEV